MCFEESWQPANAESFSREQEQTLVWLISEPGHGRIVEETLKACAPKAKAVIVVLGEKGSEQELDSNYYWLGVVGEHSAYTEVLDAIAAEYGEVDGLVYLCPVERPELARNASSIVQLLKALVASRVSCRRVLLAGHSDEDTTQAYLESWIGIERSVGAIMRQTEVKVVLERSRETRGLREWIERLWKELGQSQGSSVLYQEGQRYVSRIKAIKLKGGHSRLERGGTYWITGGCGGLGVMVAKQLARGYGANLVLSGRGELDESRRELIESLEALGASVLYGSADVSDEEAMRGLLRQAKKRFGQIDGVIHAAGVSAKKSLLKSEEEEFRQVLGAKVDGTQVLEAILAEEPLKVVCYFSSLAAVVGDFGACAYAMGNRFMLAYGRSRQRRVERGEARGETVAIGWPLWREGGMQVESKEQIQLYLDSTGQRALESTEGLELFEQLLSQHKVAEVLVIAGQPGRVRRFLERNVAANSTSWHGEQRQLVSNSKNGSGTPSLARGGSLISEVVTEGFADDSMLHSHSSMHGNSLELCEQSDRTATEQAVAEFYAEVLGLPEVSIDGNFFDLGGHSLLAMQVMARIREVFEIAVPAETLFKAPTVRELARIIEMTQLASALAPGDEVKQKLEEGII
jgi:NAD(P)-dependent dehydrogenase (short-subunit alcohol dehydrogenase family)/acyl carrier protein